MVVVQVIRTRWTKASRGAPAAAARAAVPAALAVPIPLDVPDGTTAVVHDVDAAEDDAFALRGDARVVTDRLPLRAGGLRITDVDGALDVARLREVWGGWPSRPRDRVAFRLRRDEWGRAVRNNRHGNWLGWMYTKTVVNVANLDTLDGDVFLRSEPAHVLDEQAMLR